MFSIESNQSFLSSPPLSTYQGERRVRRVKISSDSFGRAKLEVQTSARPPSLNTEKEEKRNFQIRYRHISTVV